MNIAYMRLLTQNRHLSMHLTQPQITRTLFWIEALTAVAYLLVKVLFPHSGPPLNWIDLIGAAMGVALFIAHLKGWRYASQTLVISAVLSVGFTIPPPGEAGALSLALLTPAILALVLVGANWVLISTVGTAVIVLLRSAGTTFVGDPLFWSIYVFIIGGIILARIMNDVSLRNAEQQTAELLRQQEAVRFQARLLNTVNQAVIASDVNGSITYWNRFAETLYGWTAAEVIGQKTVDLIDPPETGNLGLDIMAFVRNSGDWSGEYMVQRRDGTLFPALLTLAPIYDTNNDVVGLVGVSTDISQIKQAQEERRRQAMRAETLIRVAARLNAQLELDTVIQAVCEETAAALNAPIATVYLYQERQAEFIFAGGIGLPADAYERLHPFALEHSQLLLATDEAAYTIIPDVQLHAELPNSKFYRDLNLRTMANVQLLSEGRLIGLLNVAAPETVRTFTEDELLLLRGLADQAVRAIINARLFTEAEQRLRQVQALHMIDLAITSSMDLRVTLNVFLDQVTTQLCVDAASVLLFNPQLQTFDYAAGRGLPAAMTTRPPVRLGQGLAGRAALQRRLSGIANRNDISQEQADLADYSFEPFTAYYVVPLIARKQIKGVLELFHYTPLDPESEWLRFCETLAGQAAIAIADAEMVKSLQRSKDELALAYDATLEGWSRALDLRDRETEGHTQRVTDLTVRLAKAMGISGDELINIRRGALLHDIGKMGVPDHILRKPGPLTDEEWVIMRKHPVYAYEWLSPITFLRPALDIPYCHHEKWEGNGYPRGLKGEQIPLAARIFAVVDVWDALLSDRPYHKAWPEERVREHIRAQAGKHFDPEVVRVFFDAVVGN